VPLEVAIGLLVSMSDLELYSTLVAPIFEVKQSNLQEGVSLKCMVKLMSAQLS